MTPHDIRGIRKALGLTAADCAELVGLGQGSAWQRYEQVGPNRRIMPAPTARLFGLLVAGLPLILKAISFAAIAHQGQKRKGRARKPYIMHPLAVAEILICEGLETNSDILIAAILHDVIEDAPLPQKAAIAAEIGAEFGRWVLPIVEQVTDEPGTRGERRARQLEHAAALGPEAVAVKLADKLANLRDLDYDPPAKWTPADILAYAEHALALAERVKQPNARLLRLVREQAAVLIDRYLARQEIDPARVDLGKDNRDLVDGLLPVVGLEQPKVP